MVVIMSMMAGLVLLFLTTWSNIEAVTINANADRDRNAYIGQAHDAMYAWYRAHNGELDWTLPPPSSDQVLSALGIIRRFNVRMNISSNLISETVSGNTIRFRRIAIWLPPVDTDDGVAWADPTAFDADGNLTGAAPAFITFVTGREIELANLRQTNERLALLSSILALQANMGNLDASLPQTFNQFRGAGETDCKVASTARQSQCIDTYTNLSSTNLLERMGIAETETINAWGLPIQVSNLVDSSTTAAPFSMALRTSTPWGETIRASSTQTY